MIAKEFGITSNALAYRADGDNVELYSILNPENGLAVPAELFESYGTIRFVNEFPLIIRALLTGATLVMDEFDASIHPMALMNIINIFHNDEINKHHAQLIFNTHNPIFLDASLFRRDESNLWSVMIKPIAAHTMRCLISRRPRAIGKAKPI